MTDPYDPALEAELSAYLDGELDAAARARVDAALAASPALRERLAALRRADEELRALPDAALPPGFERALRDRLAREARPQRARAPRRVARLGVAAALAAALLAWLLVARPASRAPAPPIAQEEPVTGPEVAHEAPAPAPEIAQEPTAPAGEATRARPPSDEEIALAVELERDGDAGVVEVLDLLEALGDEEERS